MSRRVVITGLGVIAPNGNGAGEFELAIRKGRSGFRHNEAMAERLWDVSTELTRDYLVTHTGPDYNEFEKALLERAAEDDTADD